MFQVLGLPSHIFLSLCCVEVVAGASSTPHESRRPSLPSPHALLASPCGPTSYMCANHREMVSSSSCHQCLSMSHRAETPGPRLARTCSSQPRHGASEHPSCLCQVVSIVTMAPFSSRVNVFAEFHSTSRYSAPTLLLQLISLSARRPLFPRSISTLPSTHKLYPCTSNPWNRPPPPSLHR